MVFENDRGELLCGDCGKPVGLHLDRDTGQEWVCCDGCFWTAHLEPMDANIVGPANRRAE